ncbi:hypothetical protein BTUL_0313g00090 [Botrytis tulipae]|uniref:Uncharacterized protein n=1 Tax=Botrytis tulipae TaxID=87230 RepID=A0A4Z1E8V3_9HELO|nr:hypothetical protein BTUL_0313g00090 [Botrytis tulipae]
MAEQTSVSFERHFEEAKNITWDAMTKENQIKAFVLAGERPLKTPYGFYGSTDGLSYRHSGWLWKHGSNLDDRDLPQECQEAKTPTQEHALSTEKLRYFMESMKDKWIANGIPGPEFVALRSLAEDYFNHGGAFFVAEEIEFHQTGDQELNRARDYVYNQGPDLLEVTYSMYMSDEKQFDIENAVNFILSPIEYERYENIFISFSGSGNKKKFWFPFGRRGKTLLKLSSRHYF